MGHILAPWGDEGPDVMTEDEPWNTPVLICDDIALKSTRRGRRIRVSLMCYATTASKNIQAKNLSGSLEEEEENMWLCRKLTYRFVAPGIFTAIICKSGPVLDGKCRLAITVTDITGEVQRRGNSCGDNQATVWRQREKDHKEQVKWTKRKAQPLKWTQREWPFGGQRLNRMTSWRWMDGRTDAQGSSRSNIEHMQRSFFGLTFVAMLPNGWLKKFLALAAKWNHDCIVQKTEEKTDRVGSRTTVNTHKLLESTEGEPSRCSGAAGQTLPVLNDAEVSTLPNFCNLLSNSPTQPASGRDKRLAFGMSNSFLLFRASELLMEY